MALERLLVFDANSAPFLRMKDVALTDRPLFVRSTRRAAALAAAGALVLGTVQPSFAARGAVQAAPMPQTAEVIGAQKPGSLSGFYLAARHALLNKDLAAAAGFYSSALGRDPDNAELLDKSVLAHVASGNIARAAAVGERLLERDPNDQVALIAIAVNALRNREFDAAMATMAILEEQGGQLQQLVAALVSAWARAGSGEPADAIERLDALRGPIWYQPFTRLHGGLIADTFRLDLIADGRLSRAFEEDSGNLRVLDAYARHLARTGAKDRALGIIDAFEARLNGNDHVTRSLREALEADEVAPQIANAREGAAEALYGIGSAVGREGGDTFAAGLFQLSLFLAPDGYFPAMALGSVLEAMEQHERAIEVYRAIPSDAPMRRDAFVQEALNLSVLERNEEAIALLRRLVDEEPADVGTAIALGNVYRVTEDFANAAVVYTEIIDRIGEVPDEYWTLYYYRGITYERTDRWDQAEADFRKALEMEPDQPLVLNYLGYSNIDRGVKLQEGLEMVKKAVEQRPEDGYIVDSLGWAYYRLGRFEDAVRELERAVELRPADPVINDHLGDAYWRVGRKLEAMFQWTHARDSDPEPDELPKILEKLEEGLPPLENDDAIEVSVEDGAVEPVEAE